MDNALTFNRQDFNFVYFDFHEYCRGMKFENVNILIQALENDDYIKVSEIDLNNISKPQVFCNKNSNFSKHYLK